MIGMGGGTHFLSTSLMYAEKTRAFISELPAANRTLFGCQSIERTVDLMGFLRSFETHQLLSSSNEQTAMALMTTDQRKGKQTGLSSLAPSSTSNGKLVPERTPPNERSGTVDIQQHQSGLPLRPTGLRIGAL